jgi:hypothetical protein
MNRVSLSDEDIIILNLELNSVVLKAQFTEKERKFLELLLSSNYSQQDVVKKAGFDARHRQSRNLIAKRILEKYCQSAEDHKEIFRQIGFSEAEMGLMLFDLAQNAKSENVRLSALNLASKCLGLQREVIEGGKGVQIIFEGMPGSGEAAPQSPAAPGSALPEPQGQARKLSILK